MKRRGLEFLGMLGCLAVVTALALVQKRTEVAAEAALKAEPTASGDPRFVVAPYLQFPTRESMVIMWESDVPGDSLVEYAEAGEVPEGKKPLGWRPALPLKATVEQPLTMHEVTLSRLKPETKYLYRVSTTTAEKKSVRSDVLTFATAVEPETAFSFTVIGDTQKNPAVTGKLAKLMWARRPNFAIHVGDVVDEGPDKSEWVKELFAPSAELFSRVALFPAIGNHEKNHEHYYKYFSLPKPEYYYRYSYGNTDFFVVDTNSIRRLDSDGEQYKWLDRELSKSTARWKIVYHHHPPYSSDDDDYGDTWLGTSKLGDQRTRRLVPLYERHNVDLVFNGHVHVYERTWPIRAGKVVADKGIVYVTSGGGGGKLERFSPTPTWFKAEVRSDYHYCYVAVHGGKFVLKAFDQNDALFDVATLQK